jgi:hypothetical protein
LPDRSSTEGANDNGGFRHGQLAFLIVLGAFAAWIYVLPRIAHAIQSRRRGRSATERIEHNWRRAARSLGLIGLAMRPGETPLEHATRIERKTGIDRHTLRALALAATAAIYGHIGDDASAARSAELASEVIASVRRRMPLTRRLLVLADPRRADLLVAR